MQDIGIELTAVIAGLTRNPMMSVNTNNARYGIELTAVIAGLTRNPMRSVNTNNARYGIVVIND
jgi:hypothetical protein